MRFFGDILIGGRRKWQMASHTICQPIWGLLMRKSFFARNWHFLYRAGIEGWVGWAFADILLDPGKSQLNGLQQIPPQRVADSFDRGAELFAQTKC